VSVRPWTASSTRGSSAVVRVSASTGVAAPTTLKKRSATLAVPVAAPTSASSRSAIHFVVP